MTIYETLNKNPKIDNNHDYEKAVVELSRLQKIYSLGGCAVAGDAQRLSNAISDYIRKCKREI